MDRASSRSLTTVALLAATVAVGGAVALSLSGRHGRDRLPASIAERRARFAGLAEHAVAGRTVTIGRPRAELYAFWRKFGNLASFMDNVEDVRPVGPNRDVWTIAAPAGRTVDMETEVVEEQENAYIVWRSTPNSPIAAEGWVAFRDAPGGRGTEVEATIAYDPPAGELGRWVAKLFQREPNIQARRELKRFKMLMETGEIAHSGESPPDE